MAIKFIDHQKNYTPRYHEGSGLPVAEVIALGAGRWLTVCPLCSMAHDVTTFEGDIYRPTCLLKSTHPAVYGKWIKAHPDAAQHVTVYLMRPAEQTRAEPLKEAA